MAKRTIELIRKIIKNLNFQSKVMIKKQSELNIESVEVKKITTAGDLNQKDRLSEIGGKGLFSKKIEMRNFYIII